VKERLTKNFHRLDVFTVDFSFNPATICHQSELFKQFILLPEQCGTQACRGGGIGRRTGLKILGGQPRAGSIPALGIS
jgi:hypothetical protein